VSASNDNWKNTRREVIQTTGFASPNNLESAIFATLPNGNCTTILAGKNGGTGVGSLDVYKVAVATNSWRSYPRYIPAPLQISRQQFYARNSARISSGIATTAASKQRSLLPAQDC